MFVGSVFTLKNVVKIFKLVHFYEVRERQAADGYLCQSPLIFEHALGSMPQY
jgi:hypothetical protein